MLIKFLSHSKENQTVALDLEKNNKKQNIGEQFTFIHSLASNFKKNYIL